MSRGKELRGQTLVLPGSASGASTIVTRLAYDSSLSVEFIGEAKYATPENDTKWYIERFEYDSSLNVVKISTASNVRILANANIISNVTYTITGGILTLATNLVGDIRPRDSITFLVQGDTFEISAVATNGTNTELTLVNPPADRTETVLGTQITFVLNDQTTKDFNKRRWDLRELYLYE